MSTPAQRRATAAVRALRVVLALEEELAKALEANDAEQVDELKLRVRRAIKIAVGAVDVFAHAMVA